MGLKMQPDIAHLHEAAGWKRVGAVPEAHKVGLKAGLSYSLRTKVIRTRWMAAAHRHLHSKWMPDLLQCP